MIHATKPSTTIKVTAALVGSDGALIRQWAFASAGIALKSFWAIKQDLAAGNLVSLLKGYTTGAYSRDDEKVDYSWFTPAENTYRGKCLDLSVTLLTI